MTGPEMMLERAKQALDRIAAGSAEMDARIKSETDAVQPKELADFAHGLLSMAAMLFTDALTLEKMCQVATESAAKETP